MEVFTEVLATMAAMRDTAARTVPSPAEATLRTAGPSRPRRWLGAGFALCTVGWGANQFTPMLLLYRSRLGLSAAIVEATFGLYAIGLIPGLLVAGPLSDRIGRRRVVLFALVLSMVAGGVLILGAHGAGWLFAGRLVMGVASGCAFSAGAAWIKELSAPPYEHAPRGASARRAGAAMTLGFGLGPLVAGALAQWAPLPTTLPYLPQLVLAAWALPLAAHTPETVRHNRVRDADDGLWRQMRIRGLGEPRFLWVVLPLAPWVFGSAAIAMAYLPGLVMNQVPGVAVAFAAAAALCTAMSGVLVQPLARRFDRPDQPERPRLLIAGLTLVTGGLLAGACITALGQLPGLPVLVLCAALMLGCGYGICLVFGLAEVQRLARPDDLAGLTAVFQAFCYIGFAVPYLLSVLRAYTSATVLLLCVAALAASTLTLTVWQARRTAALSLNPARARR
jgi:MFS family permease